jgi:peroxiredoxin Q/BCP
MEKELRIGDPAPPFCLKDSEGNEVCLKDFEGKWVVLYFYPKDNTPGCTLEAIDFTKNLEDFEKLGATVLGVSPDSEESHKKFCEKHGLKVTLLSDKDHKVLEAYGVWKLKKRYGREYYGVERSTFLISPDGRVAHLWRNVKVKRHVEEVLKKLRELKGG